MKKGDILELIDNGGMNAPIGSTARVIGVDTSMVDIDWIDNGNTDQSNGGYGSYRFKVIISPEELFEKAKRDYPPGTEYIGLRDDKPYTAQYDPRWVPHGLNDYSGIEVGTDYVYRDGKWAEIVKPNEVPEYVECLEDYVGIFTGTKQFTKGKIYKVKEILSFTISLEKDDTGFTNGWDRCNFKPSTKEAFEKQNNKTVMSKQKLTVPVTDVLRIHSVACVDWKERIATVLSRVNADQTITFTQSEVDTMFEASTKSQLPLLEEIFGKQVKELTLKEITGNRKLFSEEPIKDGAMIEVRVHGEFENKAFWLHQSYNWELKRDSSDYLCLIPTPKQN